MCTALQRAMITGGDNDDDGTSIHMFTNEKRSLILPPHLPFHAHDPLDSMLAIPPIASTSPRQPSSGTVDGRPVTGRQYTSDAHLPKPTAPSTKNDDSHLARQHHPSHLAIPWLAAPIANTLHQPSQTGGFPVRSITWVRKATYAMSEASYSAVEDVYRSLICTYVCTRHPDSKPTKTRDTDVGFLMHASIACIGIGPPGDRGKDSSRAAAAAGSAVKNITHKPTHGGG